MKPDKSLLAIDRSRLDEEAELHCQLAFSWGEENAKAIYQLAKAEDFLKLIKAQTADRLRKDPEKYGLLKTTDSVVEEAVLLQKEVRDAQLVLARAKYQAELLKQFMYALIDRKDGIEKLTRLYEQQYWSKPKTENQTTREATMRRVKS